MSWLLCLSSSLLSLVVLSLIPQTSSKVSEIDLERRAKWDIGGDGGCVTSLLGRFLRPRKGRERNLLGSLCLFDQEDDDEDLSSSCRRAVMNLSICFSLGDTGLVVVDVVPFVDILVESFPWRPTTSLGDENVAVLVVARMDS